MASAELLNKFLLWPLNPSLFHGNGERDGSRGISIRQSGRQALSGKNTRRLFYDEIIPDGFDPFDAACDLACLIDGLLRINEAAQLNDAFAGLYADLK